MLILLPDAGAFAAVENRLSAAMLRKLDARLSEEQVVVELPKFTLETATIRLKEPLGALGLKAAFTQPPDRPECERSRPTTFAADFSNLDGTRCLYLATGLHRAFVEVDEQGTEAAARG